MRKTTEMVLHPTVHRQNFGVVLIVASLVLSVLMGVYAMKETKRLETRQDLIYAMLESDNYPLVALDEQGRVVQWNRGMEKLTGVIADEAKKVGFSGICNPDAYNKHCMNFVKEMGRFKTGRVVIVNCEIKRKCGNRTIPVRITVREIEVQGTKFAVARIDRVSQIMELGKEPDKTKVEADKAAD